MPGSRSALLAPIAAILFGTFGASCGLLTDSGFQITDSGTTDSGTTDGGTTDSGTPDAGGPVGAPGDIAFVMFDANGTDSEGFCFVAIVELAAGLQITFTDKDRILGIFQADEGSWNWTASTVVSPGTVVCILGVAAGALTASAGMVSSTQRAGLSKTVENLFALQGPITSPDVFLAGLATNSVDSSMVGTPTTFDLSGTGLVVGQTAIDFGSDGIAFLQYTGPRTGQATMADYRPLIHDAANWSSGVVSAPPDTMAFTVP